MPGASLLVAAPAGFFGAILADFVGAIDRTLAPLARCIRLGAVYEIAIYLKMYFSI
jgi:hypothetical protein